MQTDIKSHSKIIMYRLNLNTKRLVRIIKTIFSRDHNKGKELRTYCRFSHRRSIFQKTTQYERNFWKSKHTYNSKLATWTSINIFHTRKLEDIARTFFWRELNYATKDYHCKFRRNFETLSNTVILFSNWIWTK